MNQPGHPPGGDPETPWEKGAFGGAALPPILKGKVLDRGIIFPNNQKSSSRNM
jgi:hypothetical protein